MDAKGQRRSFIIAVLIVTLVGATIGYAALATNLYINGTAGVATDASWLIEFTSSEETSKSEGAVSNSFSHTGTTFEFDVTLSEPGDTITYEVDVTNNGSIDAKLNSITGLDEVNAADPVEIQYEINGLTEGEVLAAGATKTFTVTVTWTAGTDIPEGTTSKTSAITLNYVQNV